MVFVGGEMARTDDERSLSDQVAGTSSRTRASSVAPIEPVASLCRKHERGTVYRAPARKPVLSWGC